MMKMYEVNQANGKECEREGCTSKAIYYCRTQNCCFNACGKAFCEAHVQFEYKYNQKTGRINHSMICGECRPKM